MRVGRRVELARRVLGRRLAVLAQRVFGAVRRLVGRLDRVVREVAGLILPPVLPLQTVGLALRIFRSEAL